jgi:hypothetical protein
MIVSPIKGQNCATQGDRKGQDIRVVNSLAALARFVYGQDVVPKVPQYFNNSQTEILVSVKKGHVAIKPPHAA